MANSKAEPKEAKEVALEPAPVPMENADQYAVKYIGTSNVRVIRQKEWEGVGVTHETLEWHRSGPCQLIPVKEIKLTPFQFNQYILSDPDFRLVRIDGAE